MLFFEYGIAMAPQRETCSESLNSKEVTENSLTAPEELAARSNTVNLEWIFWLETLIVIE